MAEKIIRSKEVDKWIINLEPNLREIANVLRDVIFKAEPAITESVKWSRPVYSHNGNICSIDPAKDHLNLGFFEGANLPDPEGLLEGTGKEHRHIKVFKSLDIHRESFKSLIREAVKYHEKHA